MPASHRFTSSPARKRLSLRKAFLFAVLLLLPAPHARAQGYTILNPDNGGYSGGTSKGQVSNIPPPNTPFTLPYGFYNNTYGGGGSTYDDGSTASDSGTITATFTWVPSASDPNQPLPQSVIVIENCTVSALSGGGVTGNCSTGFSGDGQSSSSGGASGRQYTAKSSPGASFTVQDGPSASSSPGLGQTGNVDVSYSASASPVLLDLTGAKQDSSGNWNILVGQHCTASLSGIPSSCTVSYQWSVGGTTFQTWSDTAPTNTDVSYYVDGPGPLTSPTASWYWNDLMGPGITKNETVSCTATVTPPAGEGDAFTVSATKQVTVYRPVWTVTGTGGEMQVGAGPYGPGSGDYWLWAAAIAGSGNTGGMVWDATVSSPYPALFGDGHVVIVQLIIPNQSYTVPGIFGLSTHPYPQNGQEGLDTTFPYPWTTAGRPPYGSGLQYYGGDSPGMDLTYYNAHSATITSQFEDYLMYEPPGSAQYVPLAQFVWSTNGSASIPSSGNWADFTGSAGTVTPSGSARNFLQSNSFPEWTQIDTAVQDF